MCFGMAVHEFVSEVMILRESVSNNISLCTVRCCHFHEIDFRTEFIQTRILYSFITSCFGVVTGM
jgi:hypothetical protein